MKLPYPVDVNSLKEFPVFFSCIPVDLLDQDKRPVLEGRSIYNKPDSSDYAVCHYQGRRKKHLYHMNKMALKLAWRHTDEIIYTLQLLNFQTQNLMKITTKKVTKADRLYAVALSGFKTANYHLANSVLNKKDFMYPAYLSALSKICHGLCHLVFNTDKRIINHFLENNKIAEFYHYIDSQELLIGHQIQEVCAGPASMIKKVLALFVDDPHISINEKIKPVISNYYSYASITSLFESLSCHYEFYNTCYLRVLRKPPQKKNIIPYAHYLYDISASSKVKDIPILDGLNDLAWCLNGDDSLAVSIKKTLEDVASRIEKNNFDDKRKIDIDFLIIFNQLNDELYRIFGTQSNTRMDLKHLSFFFNAEPAPINI